MPGIISTLVSSYGGSALTTKKLLDGKLEHYRDIFTAQPQVKREMDYFAANIGKVESTEDLVKDRRLFGFVLTAFGLEDKVTHKAFMKKLLDEGFKTPKSMANMMIDPRFKELVRHLDLDNKGFKNFKNPVFIAQTQAKYVTAAFEKEVGEANPNLRLAFYFDRKASSLTSWYQVLGDRALSEVVRSGLNMSPETAKVDVDKQAQLMQSKMNISDFKDPATRIKFIEKFLVRADMASGAAIANNAALQVLNAQPLTGYTPVTFDMSLLTLLNGTKG